MAQDFEEFSRTYLRGADVYQVRDLAYDFANHWLSEAEVDPRLGGAILNQVMRAIDSILVNPASLVGPKETRRRQTQREYAARASFSSALKNLSDMAPEDVTQIQRMYDMLMRAVRKYAPNDVPLYQLDPEDAQRISRMMKTIKRAVEGSDTVDVEYEDLGDGNYEYSVVTDQGAQPLGTFPVGTPEEADMVDQRLKGVAGELKSLEGRKDREAVTSRIKIMSGDPFGFVPSTDAGEIGPEGADVMARAARADMALSAGIAELGSIMDKIRAAGERARQTAPNVNLSSLLTILTETMDDLSQASMALSQMAQGRGTLDLSQFGRSNGSWRPVKTALDLASQAAQVESLIQEAIQALGEIAKRIEADTGMAYGKDNEDRGVPELMPVEGSWRRQAAVPAVLAPEADSEVVGGDSLAEAPQESMEANDAERMLRWEASLALGAANRGIQQLQGLLQDAGFWTQFAETEQESLAGPEVT